MEEQVILESSKLIKRKKVKVGPIAKAKISVIVIIHNFHDSIKETYYSLVQEIRNIEDNFEIVFVDDGSTDDTWETLRAFADDDSRIKAIRLRAEFGEASAFEVGL